MSNIQCTGIIDSENNKIKINGLGTSEIEIDFLSDIDFTDLVSILTKQIDEEKQIDFTIDDSEDEKIKLIIETLKSIFNSYNESLTEVDEEESSAEIPF